MNKFWVAFTEKTKFNKMIAGLDAVPTIERVQQDDTWFFSAEWGTTQRDLNNLKGKIEQARDGEVFSVSALKATPNKAKNEHRLMRPE